MTVVSIGASHKTATGEALDRMAVGEGELPEVLRRLQGALPVSEVMLLSTCNRTELYAAVHDSARSAGHAAIHYLAHRTGGSLGQVSALLAVRDEPMTVRHLFAVAAGLDSMAVGEEHVVAQLRTALDAARAAGTAGPELSRLVETALHTSKRARTETSIGRAGPSMVRAGLDLAEARLGSLRGRTALVVGTGAMGALAARELREAGVGHLLVRSRTPERAARLAARVGGVEVPSDRWPAVLGDCDLVVTCTAAPSPVLRARTVAAARRRRPDRPLVLVDLAVPRDVEPGCADLPGVTVVDVEAIGLHLATLDLPADLDRAGAIVAEEAARYLGARRTVVLAPVIGALRARARMLARDELRRLGRRLPGLGDAERAETEAAMHRLVGKLLHTPTVRAKELSAAEDGELYVEVITRLFDLDPGPGSVPASRPEPKEVAR